MRKRMFTCIIIMAFVVGFSGTAYTGVDPEPFKPEINQLYAISLNLESIGKRVNDVLITPPDDGMPSPDLISEVNKLSSMSGKLIRLDELVALTMNDIIEAVLGTTPDDGMPVRDALLVVQDSALSIVALVDAYPPDPNQPEFNAALADVGAGAQGVADTADVFIRLIIASTP